MSWSQKPDPKNQLETALLRQWRRRRLQDRLSNLPLEFLVRQQSHRLARLEEDVLAKTGCLPVHRRLKRLTRNAIANGRKLIVSRPLNWLCRRRCLQPLRRVLVQGRRRLLVKFLQLLVRALRQKLRPSPGNPKR